MPRRANWTSTCANHSSGSPGQNGGSLRETAETAEGTDGADDRVGGGVVPEGGEEVRRQNCEPEVAREDVLDLGLCPELKALTS